MKGGEHGASRDKFFLHFRPSRHYYSCTYSVWVPSWGGRHVDAAYLRARSRDPQKDPGFFYFFRPRKGPARRRSPGVEPENRGGFMMRERRRAQAWHDQGTEILSQATEQQVPEGNWWNNGGEATPFDLRWRGPFEGYR